MAEYWKSTPKYWCKFCEIYVRDTGLERRNHEASGKHQGAIQRSLRTLHKNKSNEEREHKKAKDEVARLNRLVGSSSASPKTIDNASSYQAKPAPTRPNAAASRQSNVDPAAQAKAHAQQLIAMGVELPDEVRRQLAGASEWQVVSRRVVDDDDAGALSSVMLKDENGVASSDGAAAVSKGVHKRKLEDEDAEDAAEAQSASRKRGWGSTFKSFPDQKGVKDESETADLDALLSGVTKKQQTVKPTPSGEANEDEAASGDIPESGEKNVKAEKTEAVINESDVKAEGDDSAITAPPVVLFKKRKGKR